MARETKHFDLFGVDYRCRQFAAVEGLEIMERLESVDPVRLLSCTEVFEHTPEEPMGKWFRLNKDGIDKFVMDKAGVMSPLEALKCVCDIVSVHNFGFVRGWKAIKIPERFIDDVRSVSSAHANGVVSALITTETASLLELERYYSVHDAFKLLDVLTAKNVNKALADESARADAHRR